jgi:putative transcriptional regulator
MSTSFANQLLVALPTLADPNFARTVALICQHDDDGAMGVVINRASEYTLGEVLRQMDIACDDAALLEQRVLAGGPAQPSAASSSTTARTAGIPRSRSPTGCG